MLCTDYLLLPLIKIPHFLPTEQAGVRGDSFILLNGRSEDAPAGRIFAPPSSQ